MGYVHLQLKCPFVTYFISNGAHFVKDINCLSEGEGFMAQLAEWSLPTPEVRMLNPVLGNFYMEHLFIINCFEKRRTRIDRISDWPNGFWSTWTYLFKHTKCTPFVKPRGFGQSGVYLEKTKIKKKRQRKWPFLPMLEM